MTIDRLNIKLIHIGNDTIVDFGLNEQVSSYDIVIVKFIIWIWADDDVAVLSGATEKMKTH